MKKSIAVILFLISAALCIRTASAEEVLTWQACIKEAQKNHPDLIYAEEGVKAQQAAKKVTASGLYPQIDSSVAGSTAKASGKITDTYQYGITGTQLLFDGSQTTDKVKQAEENIKAAQYTFRFTSTEVRLRLRTAFINLLKAQESLNLTQEIFNIRRGNLELITLRYESGLEHKGALLNAEANLAESQFEIAQAKRDLEVAQRQLIKEMGRVEVSGVRVQGDFKVSEAALERPDFAALAKNNPSLQKLNAQKNAALFGLQASKANFLPELSASAGANKKGSQWPPDDDQWNAGLTLSFPIFEGGLKQAEMSQARAQYNQAQANERSSRDSVVVALEETWAALQDALETVGVQKKFLEAAEERAKIAEAQYSLGLIQFDNWTIIEDDLVGTKKAFLSAQSNALLAEANWIQAKGETLEYAH
ncbi:MAG: TolC family protein [Candidatus Omnitrophota bacterium]|nr:MAG: TolC family protein [Candidatus Omnitrophota bacterium]